MCYLICPTTGRKFSNSKYFNPCNAPGHRSAWRRTLTVRRSSHTNRCLSQKRNILHIPLKAIKRTYTCDLSTWGRRHCSRPPADVFGYATEIAYVRQLTATISIPMQHSQDSPRHSLLSPRWLLPAACTALGAALAIPDLCPEGVYMQCTFRLKLLPPARGWLTSLLQG